MIQVSLMPSPFGENTLGTKIFDRPDTVTVMLAAGFTVMVICNNQRISGSGSRTSNRIFNGRIVQRSGWLPLIRNDITRYRNL